MWDVLRDLAEPVCAFDLEDRILFVNPATEALLGRPLGQIAGRPLVEVFGAEFAGQVERQNPARLAGESTVYEVVLHDGDGEKVLLVTGSPLRNPEGDLVGTCGVLRDITKRKRQERRAELRLRISLALAESLRALHAQADLQQALADALCVIGGLLGSRSAAVLLRRADGRLHLASQWVDEELLLEEQPVAPQEFVESRFPWLMGQIRRSRVVVMHDIDQLPPEAEATRAELRRMGLRSAVILAAMQGGRLQGLVSFHDPRLLPEFGQESLSLLTMLADALSTTLHRRASESERSLLITAVEHSDASILVTDVAGTILYVNPAFERISGWRRQEVLGRNPRLLKSGRHDQAFYQSMWGTLLSGMVWHGTLVNRRKDGSPLHEAVTISPVLNAAGEVSRFVAVKRDLSRERDLEVQLRQAQTLEAVGRLAAGVAHEINTPAQYLGDNIRFSQEGYQQLEGWIQEARRLVESAPGLDEDNLRDGLRRLSEMAAEVELDYLQEDLPKALEQSLDGVERITRIVLAMKEFSHPGGQGRTWGDINRMLQSTVAVARSEWKHHALVSFELDPELGGIWCHVAELNQAFLNLLVNAAQAIASTGAGQGDTPMGRITLRSRRAEGGVVIELRDTGGGIPQEVLPHIFEPFFTTKEVGKGTGQGLAVVHRVVAELHGGRVEVESEPGVGSVFRLMIPTGSAPAAEEEVSHA